MKHYVRYRYWLAALLNFGLKLQLVWLRHAPRNFPKLKVFGVKQSA